MSKYPGEKKSWRLERDGFFPFLSGGFRLWKRVGDEGHCKKFGFGNRVHLGVGMAQTFHLV